VIKYLIFSVVLMSIGLVSYGRASGDLSFVEEGKTYLSEDHEYGFLEIKVIRKLSDGWIEGAVTWSANANNDPPNRYKYPRPLTGKKTGKLYINLNTLPYLEEATGI